MSNIESQLQKDSVFFAPLGGVGEIGMNLSAVIYKKRAFLIDCGIMFPEPGMWGVDIVVPKIQFLLEHHIEVEAIVLTHAHEDHIGALPFVLAQLRNSPKVYGTAFTLALAKSRVSEHLSLDEVDFVQIDAGENFEVGPFKIEAIQTTHSTVDSVGLNIDTPVGRLVHSGDFKIESDPVDGRPFNSNRLEELGKKGVHVLFSDSTNVERPGWSRPEKEVSDGLYEVISSIEQGKVIVALFASNIHRLNSLIEVARKVGRKVVLCGRSVIQNVGVAQNLGYLKLNESEVLSFEDVKTAPPEKVLIIATGSQAEPRSALYKMSLNDHPHIKLHKGDTVVFSSRDIPGNEKNISHMVNNLYRRGAHVVQADDAPIHASGHAYQEEQKKMMEWVSPKFFVPVHGEYRMLVKHAEAAKNVLPNSKSLVCENGDLVEIAKNKIQTVAKIPWGKIYLDEAATDVPEETLRDRRRLARKGLVIMSMVIDQTHGEVLDGPDLYIQGVNEEEVDTETLKRLLLKHFETLSDEAKSDDLEVEEELRIMTRRFFYKALGTKPHVIPLIYEV